MMTRARHSALTAISLLILLGSLSACTTNPFDPTTDTVSSTSGRTWWNEDGLIRPEHKAIAFATYAQANLEQDAAKGHGEYLNSLGVLLGITPDTQPDFQAAIQQRFQEWLSSNHEARLAAWRTLAH